MSNAKREDLSSRVSNYATKIQTMLTKIQRQTQRRDDWIALTEIIRKLPNIPDEAVLKEMTGKLGCDCLKELVKSQAPEIIKAIEREIELTTDMLEAYIE